MPLDQKLLENLLHEAEGTSLDFKSEQYSFTYASDGEKSKLLKDILAFANSWRRTTAYILIGVEEVKGGRSRIVGVQEHLDDAVLHQFVNVKTQRPVEFTYQVVNVEGTTIGVIEIPVQKRPIYLKGKFAGLLPQQVIIRDGSSTRPATPDEIAKMGEEEVIGGTPDLSLQWADLTDRTVLPSPHAIRAVVLEPLLPPGTFSDPRRRSAAWALHYNLDFSSEVIDYAARRAFLTSLGLRLQNRSSVVGKRIRFIGHIAKSAGIEIRDWIANPPSRTGLLGRTDSVPELRDSNDIDLTVREFPNRWEIEVDFGDLRPRDEAWTTNSLFVGSTNPGIVSLKGDLRGDNLPEPVDCELQIQVEVDHRAMDAKDVAPYL